MEATLSENINQMITARDLLPIDTTYLICTFRVRKAKNLLQKEKMTFDNY